MLEGLEICLGSLLEAMSLSLSVGSFLPLWAEAFPRGPGLYFSTGKLIVLLMFYCAWARTLWWLDGDSRNLDLDTQNWNLFLLGGAVFGALVFWLSSYFFATFLIWLLLYLGPTLAYVQHRNQRVDTEQRLLTRNHLRELARKYLRLKLGDEEEEDFKGPPIRFIAKSTRGEDDDDKRIRRVQESPGYKAALKVVHKAIELRTTDVHMEPTRKEMTIRFRVDGILHADAPMDRSVGDAVVNVFKVLANLDITEKRKPQDGSFGAEVASFSPSEKRARASQRKKAKVKAKAKRGDRDDVPLPDADGDEDPPPTPVIRQVDFRVATAGSVAGEKLVLRILDRSRQVTTLGHIGMRDQLRDQVRTVVGQPHGMFIVCGPTGAGKSTTLYACLSEIDRFQKNVITLENPVEYHIDNVTQIEVNPKAGKTFASELRSILRQDPDVIYIGEIRDQETAEIACQAAQTGHMVFTTLHANDTVTAIGRLLDLHVQPFMVASAVSAILCQRLVRVLCSKCKQRYKPAPEALRKINLNPDKIAHLYRPRDVKLETAKPEEVCKNCGGTGYYGRTGVYELLVLTDSIRELIRENPNLNAIRQEAVKTGMKYLQQDGLRQVIEGETSIQEVLRVCK